ncbi:MAG: hypothetical protein KGL53_02155, partial [Elusimicrobia bacterium]|nr:hypothetical protein [Elusimicrobiota bacterium]
VRFDDARGVPDLAASKGVIGWVRSQGSLYVSLDGSDPRVVALSARPPRRPFLETANFAVSRWTAEPGRVAFLKRGWWTSACTLGGLVPGARYRARGADLDATLTADKDGTLALSFPDAEDGGPARPVTVEAVP